MSSTVTTTVGNTVVVTHVHPANANANDAENTQQPNFIRRFVQGRPQVLGTVQIIIGLMVFLFGIAMTPMADSFAVYSGIFVWGAGFYITAGSLTVAAARRQNRCLISCALGFCIVAVITATIATILYALDAATLLDFLRCHYGCHYQNRMGGMYAVLALFNLLQLLVSAVVLGYACNATCNRETPSVVVGPRNAAPNTDEMQTFKGEASAMIPPHPPAYNTVVN